jgi:hypothetical protein
MAATASMGFYAGLVQRIGMPFPHNEHNEEANYVRYRDIPTVTQANRLGIETIRSVVPSRLSTDRYYFCFWAPTDSSARSPGVCASFESTLPLRASTWTAAIFFVKGVMISMDQISWPFSRKSFALLTFPPGTFASAALSACARVMWACKLGDVCEISVAKVVP